MSFIVAHKIRLKPTKQQQEFLVKCCGVARFVYNWGLANWKLSLDNKQKTNWMYLDKKLNSIKKLDYPWMTEVACCISQQALAHLGRAMTNFFKTATKFPVFKKKGHKNYFNITNHKGKTEGKKLYIPKCKPIKMYEKLRFTGKVMSYVISRQADQWFVSITVDTENIKPLEPNENQVGIDLGIKTFATFSDGTCIQNPKSLRSNLKAIKRLHKSLSNKVKGSKNRFKARMKLAKKHLQIFNQRKEFLHRITTEIVRKYQIIKIEDLNVSGMLKNRKLALAISEVGFYEFKRQLTYKCAWYGRTLKLVDQWYPSSKTCSNCGCIKEELKLNERIYVCGHCGIEIDRDLNAAINICNVPI